MQPVRPQDRRIWLGSRSPRRRALLEQLGFQVLTRSADLCEIPEPGETPEAYTLRLAQEKGRAVRDALVDEGHVDAGPSWVVAADTIVVLDGQRILEKPADVDDAIAILTALSGRAHEVLTGFWLGALAGGVERHDVVRSGVQFRDLSRDTIVRYVHTGEPMDKAGAYGIQGIGAALVRGVQGSYFNIVGLPIAELVAAMNDVGALVDFPFAGEGEG